MAKKKKSVPVASTKATQQQAEVGQVVSSLSGDKTQGSDEQMTVREWLSVARTMLWVANEGYCNVAHKLPYDEQRAAKYMERKIVQSQIGVCIDTLDKLQHNQTIPDEPPQDVGIPPNEALRKLARIILSQHGQRTLLIGSCAFTG